MKKIITALFIIVGFVIAAGAVGRAETDITFSFVQLVMQTFAGFMVMGAGIALARWK